MKKKINCVVCGGSRYHSVYLASSGETRSPCGGCDATGFQWVEDYSQTASGGTASNGKDKGGCLIVLAPMLIVVAAGAAHSFLA